jgi:hypothetical protein
LDARKLEGLDAGKLEGWDAGKPECQEAMRLRSREASRIRLIIPEANCKVEEFEWLMIKVALYRALPW